MYDFVAVMGGIWLAFYFMVLGLKRWLTYPRIGYTKIAEGRRQQMKMVILGVVLFLLGLSVFFIFMVDRRPAWLSEYFMFIFGVMITVVIAALGYWWKVSRWYLYGVMVLVSFCIHQWLDVSLNLAFIVPGGIITLLGLGLLVSFLRRYPKAREELDAGA
jgi:hypothetical protein